MKRINGIKIHVIAEKKFKDIGVSIRFSAPLRKALRHAACWQCCFVITVRLIQASRQWPIIWIVYMA